ncbi:hypothetical protein GGE12_005555 [Rhizobium mongolense]|uniref:Uncharacterized protein n=1 Tax=Rhizobium mongolense TaxID=57676 RepID=A0A7W6WGY8_9HYPH|nr:hypothetical protein [Rhizobium mongolense]
MEARAFANHKSGGEIEMFSLVGSQRPLQQRIRVVAAQIGMTIELIFASRSSNRRNVQTTSQQLDMTPIKMDVL